MDTLDFLLGHEPIGRRFNIKNELQRLRRNPLDPLLALLDKGEFHLISNNFSRYREAYRFYYLSFARYLPAMSIAARYSHGPLEKRKSGGTQRYSGEAGGSHLNY